MDPDYWTLIGEKKIIPKKHRDPKIGQSMETVQQYTVYRSKVDGEIKFVLHYATGEPNEMTEAEILQLVGVKTSVEDGFDMAEICRLGNRRGPTRVEAYLPDKFVYNFALANTLKVRGESPLTFDDFLRIVSRTTKPIESQSIHSPGHLQQFTSAAAIMAEPVKVGDNPEDAPSPPKRAPRKRPGPKVKEPSAEEEPVKRKKRASPAATTKKSEPKRRKAAEVVVEPATRVINRLGELVKSRYDKLDVTKIQITRAKHNYKEITVGKFSLSPSSDLDITTIIFALTYLWSTRLTFKTVKLESESPFVDHWSETVCAAAGYCAKAAKQTFDDIGSFALKGMCYRSSNTAKTLHIYHSSLVTFLERLAPMDDETLDEELGAALKQLSGTSGNSGKLLFYCESLLNPALAAAASEPEPEETDF